MNKIKHLQAQVTAVTSTYWGEGITVAGLITSQDLIDAIIKVQKSTPASILNQIVIIPSAMLRPFTQDFLDGKTLDYVKEKTGLDFFVIENCYSTKEIVDYILSK